MLQYVGLGQNRRQCRHRWQMNWVRGEYFQLKTAKSAANKA
jgi:hypothetical protein